ncbi:hypothetical protein ACHAWF_010929 [Thalassiosira exigua]
MDNDAACPPPNSKRGKKRRRKKSTTVAVGICKHTSHAGDTAESCDERRSVPDRAANANQDDSNKPKIRPGDYPYPTDYNDHFETPARAYDDIFPLLMKHILDKKQKRNKKRKGANQQSKKGRGECNDTTIIYDPYYCTGRAATLLKDVFQRHKSDNMPSGIQITHEKRDFYRDIRQNSVPKYDVLITNPPYSGNHKERCLEFAVDQLKSHGRPFFLLMPNYVATKEYFRYDSKEVRTLFVTPSASNPYEYDHPEGTGHQTSPFASVWFCGLSYGEGRFDAKSTIDAFVKFHSSRGISPTGAPRIATSLQGLIQMGGVSGERRKNPRQRRKMRQQAMQRANNAAAGGGGGAAGVRTGNQSGRAIEKRKHCVIGSGQSKSEGENKSKKHKFKSR